MAADDEQLTVIKSVWALTQLAKDDRFPEGTLLQMAKRLPEGEHKRPLMITLLLRRLEGACASGAITCLTLRSLLTLVSLMAKELKEAAPEGPSYDFWLEVATQAALTELRESVGGADVESILQNTFQHIDDSEGRMNRCAQLRSAAKAGTLGSVERSYPTAQVVELLLGYVAEARKRMGSTSLEAVLDFVAGMNQVASGQLVRLSGPSLRTLLQNTLAGIGSPRDVGTGTARPAPTPRAAPAELSAAQVTEIANSPAVLQAIQRVSGEVCRREMAAGTPGTLLNPQRQEERDAAGALCDMGDTIANVVSRLTEKADTMSAALHRGDCRSRDGMGGMKQDALAAAHRATEAKEQQTAVGVIRHWQDSSREDGAVSPPPVSEPLGAPSGEAPRPLKRNRKTPVKKRAKRVGKRRWTETEDWLLLQGCVDYPKEWQKIFMENESYFIDVRDNVDMKDRWRNLLRREGGLVNYYVDLHRRHELAEPGVEQVAKLAKLVEDDTKRDLSSRPPEALAGAEEEQRQAAGDA